MKDSYLSKDDIKKSIDKMKKLQLETGSKDDYGQGLYNGMELIKATLLDIEPKYLSLREFRSSK